MLKHIRPAVVLIVLMTLLTGIAYPFAVSGVAQVLFPRQAMGSLIERDGKVVGSELIGQNFAAERYFHGRPSATTDTDPADATKTVPAPYNASNSSGSNLAPTSKALVERVQADVAKAKTENAIQGAVPADLITTSASGLDPHISPSAADAQVARVARVRNAAEDRVRQLVAANTENRTLGFIGEPRVNVLKLNLALDTEKAAVAAR